MWIVVPSQNTTKIKQKIFGVRMLIYIVLYLVKAMTVKII